MDIDKNDKDRRQHYVRAVGGCEVDAYLLLTLFKVNDPGLQHAFKKLMRAGKSYKSFKQDIDESTVSVKRSLEILEQEMKIKSSSGLVIRAGYFIEEKFKQLVVDLLIFRFNKNKLYDSKKTMYGGIKFDIFDVLLYVYDLPVEVYDTILPMFHYKRYFSDKKRMYILKHIITKFSKIP